MTRTLLPTTLLLLLPLSAGAQDPVPYRTLAGDQVNLTPWQGEHVAVLTPPADELDADVMRRILDAFDAAYEYNARISGAEPTAVEENMLNGRAVIAIVPQERVAALPRPIGTPGMEISPAYWKRLYDGVATGSSSIIWRSMNWASTSGGSRVWSTSRLTAPQRLWWGSRC